MQKGLSYFLLIITFILGVSVGMYTEFNKNAISLSKNTKNYNIEPVQDVVIKKVQNEKNIHEDSGDELIVETIGSEEKISPYAKLVIRKKFSKCNHITVNIIDVPKELINLPRKSLEEKYSGWKIEKFSPDEIVIDREIEANCEDHFVLKEKDGDIGVYNELTEDKMNLIEMLSVNVELLSDEDKKNLQEGIRVYGKDNLNSLIEDYSL